MKEITYITNRFPFMATFGYVVARKQGYNEELSKAIGLGIATYYAILSKVGVFYRPAKTPRKPTLDDRIMENSNSLEQFNSYQRINFAGAEFILNRDNPNEILGIANIRGKQYPFTADKFDFKITNKFNELKDKGFAFLVAMIQADLEKDKPELNLGTPFRSKYFEYWKIKRDLWREEKKWK
jgi:hypothetical protein